MKKDIINAVEKVLLRDGEMNYSKLIKSVKSDLAEKYVDDYDKIWFLATGYLISIVKYGELGSEIYFEELNNFEETGEKYLFRHKYSLETSDGSFYKSDTYLVKNALLNYINLFENGSLLNLFKYIEDNKEKYSKNLFNKFGDLKIECFLDSINKHINEEDTINGLKALRHNGVIYISKDISKYDNLIDLARDANEEILPNYDFISSIELVDLYKENPKFMFESVDRTGNDRYFYSALLSLINDKTNKLATFKVGGSRYYLFNENKFSEKNSPKLRNYLSKNIIFEQSDLIKNLKLSVKDLVGVCKTINIGNIKYCYLEENEEIVFQISKYFNCKKTTTDNSLDINNVEYNPSKLINVKTSKEDNEEVPILIDKTYKNSLDKNKPEDYNINVDKSVVILSEEMSNALKEFYEYINTVKIPCNNCVDDTKSIRSKLANDVKNHAEKIIIKTND